MSTLHFYRNLPALSSFEQGFDDTNYHAAPTDWYIITTDIVNSTKAIKEGRYKDVNLVGASCIMAIENAFKEDTDIPHTFGGDGATFLIPKALINKAVHILADVKKMVRDVYDMELRIGVVQAYNLIQQGFNLAIAKLSLSTNVHTAMFNGTAINEADRLVKSGQYCDLSLYEDKTGALDDVKADYGGLECRWEPIKPERQSILSLIVQSRKPDDKDIYKDVLMSITEIYKEQGTIPKAIQKESFSLTFSLKRLKGENSIRTYKKPSISKFLYYCKQLSEGVLGSLIFKFNLKLTSVSGAKYLEDVVTNTDYQKFDGTLRMILDSSEDQISRIKLYLKEQHKAANINYGYHISDRAQLTCLIFNREDSHLHFIDGANGGYAAAAAMLKKQEHKN